jgi:predicted house-cleaning noncanonical NTP pyrophosphatase (MazG superfamily)
MWAAIKLILTSLPLIAEAVKSIITWYNKYQEDRILKHYETKKKVRDNLTRRITNATTDAERDELAKLISLVDSSY